MLLAYYVAGINIEAVYHDVRGEENGEYEPYERIVFQDTFQSSEQENQLKGIFPFNHERIEYQQQLPFTVVLGNPPYSKGQKSKGDNSPNVRYPTLDERITTTYARSTNLASLKNMLYDSYIRAFRWASDRLGERGVIGFVTGAGWLDGNSASGIRACFEREFNHIYVVNLRGNARTSGETRKKEAGNVFDQASRSAITLTFLLKDANKEKLEHIQYLDIGDYLSRSQKLEKIKEFKSIENSPLKEIKPNKECDWIEQRDAQFDKFLPLRIKSSKFVPETPAIFNFSTFGIITQRDAYIYNFSKDGLLRNVREMTEFFNSEVERYAVSGTQTSPNDFVNFDRSKISWSNKCLATVRRKELRTVKEDRIFLVDYRPFNKLWCYFDRDWIWSACQTPQIFPDQCSRVETIVTTGAGNSDPSAWFVSSLMDLNLMAAGCNAYPKNVSINNDQSPWAINSQLNQVNEGIVNAYLPSLDIDAPSFFYYVYGMLHSIEYQHRFINNLKKDIPKIPIVETSDDFLAFSHIGRQLADLHLNYEDVEEYPVVELWIDQGTLNNIDDKEKFRVEKMRFLQKNDKTTIRYNNFLTVSKIPDEAHDFMVNGKSCIGWVMDRQVVSTHKASGITNDANDFANETMTDPAYPLRLLKKAITVGIKTREIQSSMPPLRIHKKMGG